MSDLNGGATDPMKQSELALAAGDQRAALSVLLAAHRSGSITAWGYEQLARIHRRLAQPERAIAWIEQARCMGGTDVLDELEHVLARDLEQQARSWARFELVTGRPAQAYEAALRAISVREPTLWSVRIFAEAARKAGKIDSARQRIAELVPTSPNPAALHQVLQQLDHGQ